jgi:hypothetical protein
MISSSGTIGCARFSWMTFTRATSRRTWKHDFFASYRCSTTQRPIRTCACRQATTSRSCAVNRRDFTRSASTASGGSSFDGMAAEVKRRTSISTITVIAKVFHADDQAQAGNGRRNSGSGIHGAYGSLWALRRARWQMPWVCSAST